VRTSADNGRGSFVRPAGGKPDAMSFLIGSPEKIGSTSSIACPGVRQILEEKPAMQNTQYVNPCVPGFVSAAISQIVPAPYNRGAHAAVSSEGAIR